MRARKRGGGDLTRSSIDNKRTRCGAGETAKSLVSGGLDGGSNQVVLSDLGEELALELSKSVVSLALSVGHFACSGIAIECKESVTRFLTTGSLARALYNEGKYHDDVKIEVRHEGNVVTGFLEEHDLNHEYSIVKVTSPIDVIAVFFNRALQFMPHCKVVSLGRNIFGKLMAASGKLSPESYASSEYLMFSSCKLSEVWEGGPLFDFAGNIAGMNVVPSMERSLFVPKSLIIERLQHFWTSQERVAFLQWVKMLKMIREGQTDSHPEVHGDAPHNDLHGDLEALAKSCIISLHTVKEDPFGDVYPRCVWRQFDKAVFRMINQSVVSLASFRGDTMFCACSGFAIDWDDECKRNDHQTILTSACLVRTPKYPFDDGNKIADGLRIEVVLPNKQRREGTLMHYNLLNNVVLVSVRKSCSVSPVILKHEKVDQSSKLVAVGRCFKSGDLMASSGKLVIWSSPYDYQRYPYGTTCGITKAGIGGPLVDVNGHYIGMNLSDSELGTPFLFSDDILDILNCFKKGVRKTLPDDITNSHAELHGDAPNKDPHESLKASDRQSEPHGDAPNKDRHEMEVCARQSERALDFIYTFTERMSLFDTLTRPFGDAYRRCAWRQLDKGVYKMIKQNVVSLASYKGDTSFFACSGCVIDWDDGYGDNERHIILTSACLVRNPEYPFDDGSKIVDGLRIEVLLPNKQRREGTLIRYNLHYNVALVSVKELFSVSPLVLLCKREMHRKVKPSSKLIAVGRCFKSGDLMASSGKRVHWSGPFDCKKLGYSSCRVSKAGIGGPLLDVHGNYMGMNFYDPRMGTPVLLCDYIVKILDFYRNWSGAEADNFRIAGDDSVSLNRWPVTVISVSVVTMNVK